MNTENACLGCGEPFDWGDVECPACGWDRDEWAASGRHGLEKAGHGEPEEDGETVGAGGETGGAGGETGGLGPIR